MLEGFLGFSFHSWLSFLFGQCFPLYSAELHACFSPKLSEIRPFRTQHSAKAMGARVKARSPQCEWGAPPIYIPRKFSLSLSLQIPFYENSTIFWTVCPSVCQSDLGFLSIQCYFFSFNSPNYLFFRSLLSRSWSLLSVSVTVSECLFKPASTSVTLPFIVIPWKRLASKLPLMLAQTVIL